MNPAACVSKVLEKIAENLDSLEENQSIHSMVDSVCEIGCFALKKSLPCHLLKNVFLILRKTPLPSGQCSSRASEFFHEVDLHFKSENLNPDLKLILLSYHTPTAETEVLKLLNLCTTISKVEELPSLKTNLSTSLLPSACEENQDLFHKVNCILRETFNLSGRHPAVGYLSFLFNQAVKNCSTNPCSISLFNNEFSHLEVMLSLPLQCFSQQDQTFYLKQLLSSLVSSVEKDLCNETDVSYFCAVFPSFHHQALTYFTQKNAIFNVYKFLRIIYGASSDLNTIINRVLKDPIWSQML